MYPRLKTSVDFYAAPVIIKEPVFLNGTQGYMCLFGGWTIQLKYFQFGECWKEEEDYLPPEVFTTIFVSDLNEYRNNLWKNFMDIFDRQCNIILA
jgi:hypothetical protein